ncbi:MAG: Rpn family recombination-promoting nuclease/putative transposase [Candidatus Poribacteria bacterium]|nr:Rpn family recombination-promoting nuclease/putative transposase [Candidatus Poribacteria bacterium]
MVIERELRELSNVSSHHFPDRSAKWLIRQREHLEAVLRMVAGQIADALDFAHVEQLNRSFISDELRPQESDMIFRVPFRSPTQTRQEVIVYLLIEHQSTVDPSMGLRLLSYMVQIWMEERRQWQEEKRPQSEWQLTPIVPIVFYTGKGEWRAPLSLTPLLDIPEVLTRFVPTFDALLLDVKATAPDALTAAGHPLGWLLSILQHEDSDAPVMRQALLEALEGLRDLHTDDADQYRRAILYIFLLILHRRDASEHQDLLRILTREDAQNQEIVDMAASIIELSEQRGHQLGIEQGIEQGARRTSIESTLAILNTRFPDADVQTLTPTLEAIADLNRLKQLNIEASIVVSFHAFQEQVDA